MRVAGIILLTIPIFAVAQTSSGPANNYVGSQVCKACHPDVWQNF
jgi:hypothetical protein